MRWLKSVILSIVLVGCASSPTGQSPQSVVFATRAAYEAALIVAVEYKKLPVCTVPAPAICSDPGIVTQLQQADNVANIAITSATSAVRTPQVGSNAIDKAIVAANAALGAFTAITSQLRTK